MFGIGSTELLVILVVALIVLGPKSIPGIAKTLGKAMGEFRRVSTEFQRTMNAEVAQDEHEKRKKEAEEELFGAKAAAPKAEAPTPEAAAQPYTMQKQETAASATPVAPTAYGAPDVPDAPAPVSATTMDATSVDAATGAPLNQDSPLAQAVARAEAEARGETLAAAEPSTAQSAPEYIKSGEKA